MTRENIVFHSRVKIGLVLIQVYKMHVSGWHVLTENGESNDTLRRKENLLEGKNKRDS